MFTLHKQYKKVLSKANIIIMKLELTNINKIKNAVIDLKGLTVIAGTNDTGKSTLGKVLFSVVKSMIGSYNNMDERRASRIQNRLSKVYNTIASKSYSNTALREQIRNEFLPPKIMKELSENTYGNGLYFLDEKERKIVNDLFERKKIILKDTGIINKDSYLFIELDNIVKELVAAPDEASEFNEEFQLTIESEFLGNICSAESEISSIDFYNELGSIMINMQEDKIKKVKIENDPYYSQLDDITFVETPLYMQLMNVFSKSITYRERETVKHSSLLRFNPVIPLHIKDLVNKLELSQYTLGEKDNANNQIDIENIIDGHFEYDKGTKDLILIRKQKGKKVKVKPINVASGIKTFGLLQILLEVNEINEKKMLIMDEPENHLHPKWQIECARLIVQLAKAGIPIMISSHSPYFIQGIRYFVNKEKIEGITNYYLAEEDEETGMSIVNDVTEDLNRVFVKLAEPLNAILNLD